MSYWSAKADLAFMETFKTNVLELWRIEDDVANWEPPRRSLADPPSVEDAEGYKEVRERIAGDVIRADSLASRHKVGHLMSTVLRQDKRFPPPRQNMEDGLNSTIGAITEEVRIERRHVRNPLWWVKQVIASLLRIPQEVMVLMGANREALEKEMWPKVLAAVLIAGILAWLGLKP